MAWAVSATQAMGFHRIASPGHVCCAKEHEMLALLVYLSSCITQTGAEALVLGPLDSPELPSSLAPWRAEVKAVRHGPGYAVEVDFSYPGWSCVAFKAPEGQAWDWSGWEGIAIDLYNPQQRPILANVTLHSNSSQGEPASLYGGCVLPANGANRIVLPFDGRTPGNLWGMHALPGGRLAPSGKAIDPSRVTQFFLYPVWVEESRTFLITSIRLVRGTSGDGAHVVFPFVDEFGQYMHADWPEKLHSIEELENRTAREQERLASMQRSPGFDELGAWEDGPQLEGTGWFRTAQVDGKWWLVTPRGKLFFSLGVNAVNIFQYTTFIEGRDGWFAWVPEREGSYEPFFRYVSHVHSMADEIGGEGQAFIFAGANLYRKHGAAWRERFRDGVYKRFAAWGFNTIGVWAADDIYNHSPIPFTVSIWIGFGRGFRKIEGGRGYWTKMPDVYDPDWERAAEDTIRLWTRERGFGDNPLCIGYMVDNELPWEQVAPGVLPSPSDQPCRVAFINQLKANYGAIGPLNAAWGVSARNWDTLQSPAEPNEACKADLDAFVYTFARRYFDTIARLLHKHAPNQLYLGCRFAYGSFTHPEAERACAEAVDVMTYNIYASQIDPAKWTGPNDHGKPVLISEFSFGAMDSGMFYPNFIAVEGQAGRARHYRDYVRSVAECPSFVGCHWYQYRDNPLTGSTHSGENRNYGLVDVTDTPYTELVEAAREMHGRVYSVRAGSVGAGMNGG
jgi:hypothetical protein